MRSMTGPAAAVGTGLLALFVGAGFVGSHGLRAQSTDVGDGAETLPPEPSAPLGGVCNSDVACEFDGFPNIALGQSLLTETGGQLFVSPIGSTGDDGVRIVNDLKTSSFETAHNDWTDLGQIGLGDIDEAANGVGSYVQTEVAAMISNFTYGLFVLRVEQIGTPLFEVSHDFSAAGPIGIDYEVLAAGGTVCTSGGQAVDSTVTVTDWPTSMAFSELRFPPGTGFTLPTASCTGDELHITPLFSGTPPQPLFALQNDVTVRKVFLFENLSPFVILNESFGVPAPPSGMGFSAAIQLTGPGVFPQDGTNVLALPWSRQLGMFTSQDLISDMGGAACAGQGPVVSVARYLKRTAGLESYSGCAGKPFALSMGEAYLVKVDDKTPYRAVGLHRPAMGVTFTGPAAFPEDGTNLYAHPYHAVSTTAADLIAEIGGADCSANGPVVSIARYIKATAGLESYSGCAGSNFALTHGEGYFVKVSSEVSFVPSHF